ncbi:hypothetical protein GEU84_009675 [Fertoebacter nigrum]|uniref:Uncharacterized protein n=1 Tax=Fertoeibacter niger TaxID=2656921 RepID=A0A8X8H057_9RHOB|nr:hypothetical protein [Fertoeibacter niger]NUB44651.1 hypothetical protein [Fertoeibacter niger]
MTLTATTTPDTGLAYFAPAPRPAIPAPAKTNPAQAALDLMFGYFDQK